MVMLRMLLVNGDVKDVVMVMLVNGDGKDVVTKW